MTNHPIYTLNIFIYIYIYIYIYCDACPERSLPSPWKPTRITCTSSSRAGRAHLRLITAGLDKPPQHTHWGDMSPEDSMLTLKSALYSREQRLTGQPRTRARHGGQPLESTSTARRTATGEHEHKSSGEPITNPRQREAYIPETLIKLTLRGIYLTPPCRVILHPVTLVENAEQIVKDHRQANIFFVFVFFLRPLLVFFSELEVDVLVLFSLLIHLVVSPTGGDSSPDMEELLKHLTEVSIRQQQIVEHMAARQGESEREIAALRTAAAQRVPLPDPRVQATQLLPKMSAHDDVESYLMMFEASRPRRAGRGRSGPGYWLHC